MYLDQTVFYGCPYHSSTLSLRQYPTVPPASHTPIIKFLKHAPGCSKTYACFGGRRYACFFASDFIFNTRRKAKYPAKNTSKNHFNCSKEVSFMSLHNGINYKLKSFPVNSTIITLISLIIILGRREGSPLRVLD